jgi:TatD DNase family protein
MLIDAHVHMDRYEGELDRAMEEIRLNRIFTVSTSMSIPSYQRNLKIAGRCGHILPTFGVHPWNASGYSERLEELDPCIERSPMLGEIGLDYHYVKHAHRYPAQRKVFEHFLAAAARQDKVVNVHTKGAEADVLELLDRYGPSRVIVHWYSGPGDILAGMIRRGYYFTIGVEVTQSETIRGIALRIPGNRLLAETDNPGALKWLSGSPGMPSAIRTVLDALASIRQTTPRAIEAAVHSNFLELVSRDPWLSAPHRRLLETG